MFHKQRRWCVTDADEDSIEWLANHLTQYDWCCCHAVRFRGLLFLNDGFTSDTAQEYAVIQEPTADCSDYLQFESITFSWCSDSEAIAHINSLFTGEETQPRFECPIAIATSRQQVSQALGTSTTRKYWKVEPQLETPEEHGSCPLCA